MKKYTDEVLADMTDKVKLIAGEHYETLMQEFVDLNDARVGTCREYMDLGIPREVAENILEYLRLVHQGLWGDVKNMYADESLKIEDSDACLV